MCYDPVNHLLVTNINRFAAVIRMIPRDSIDAVEKANPEILRAETGRQLGTPYIMKRDYLFKLDNGHILPQFNPPWGTILAIDSRSGRKIWEVPLGYMLNKETYPDAEKWGSINFGGAIVTAGNLIFVAATMEGHFRAFDTRTGEKRWDQALPAAGQATPMTFAVNGKQFVVIAAGGHGKLSTKQGDYVVAYSLPKHE
jgi:quinoprotein glucose dehydrogenase